MRSCSAHHPTFTLPPPPRGTGHNVLTTRNVPDYPVTSRNPRNGGMGRSPAPPGPRAESRRAGRTRRKSSGIDERARHAPRGDWHSLGLPVRRCRLSVGLSHVQVRSHGHSGRVIVRLGRHQVNTKYTYPREHVTSILIIYGDAELPGRHFPAATPVSSALGAADLVGNDRSRRHDRPVFAPSACALPSHVGAGTGRSCQDVIRRLVGRVEQRASCVNITGEDIVGCVLRRLRRTLWCRCIS